MHHFAAEIESAEVIAQQLLLRARLLADQMPQRRFIATQLLELMLREISDRKPLPLRAHARNRRELAGEELDQRRLAGAVGPEQADARAGTQRKLDRAEHRPPFIPG